MYIYRWLHNCGSEPSTHSFFMSSSTATFRVHVALKVGPSSSPMSNKADIAVVLTDFPMGLESKTWGC